MIRRWRRLALALLLCAAAPSGLGVATGEPDATVLVTVTEVGAGRAVLWLRSAAADRISVRVTAADDVSSAQTIEALTRPDWDHIVRLPLDGLRPGTRYAYEVTGAGRVSGTFSTAPAADSDRPVRLLWSGDLGGMGYCRDGASGYPIFRAMARRNADFFLFVGDTIYADHPCRVTALAASGELRAVSLDGYRAKHLYNRADPAVQDFFRRTPVYAIWDDHEVANNFAGPLEWRMPIGRRAFRDYWGIAGPPDEPDRLYRSARWGRGLEVFILDTRQYRSRNADPDGPDKTMLGAAQRAWLLEGLSASDATWKLVVTSVPLGVFTGSDSWTSANILGVPRVGAGFAWERDLILRTLRERGVRNVVFIAGDVHFAQFVRHEVEGYVVHELMAGPLAARAGFPRFLDRSLNSTSLASLGFTHNFGELVADGGTLTAWIRDGAGAKRGKVTLKAQ